MMIFNVSTIEDDTDQMIITLENGQKIYVENSCIITLMKVGGDDDDEVSAAVM